MDRHGWDRRYETKELVWTAEPNRFLVSEVAGLTPGSALDLAAGEGRNAVWLAEQGWQVTAVDFSAVGLAKAGELAAARGVGITTVCADATDYVPPEQFDLVVVFYLQLAAEPRREAYLRAADAVAPGGTLVIVGHDSTNLADGYGGPQEPAVLFSPDDVLADIAPAGLTVERAERVERPVDTPDGPRVAIDALVRARRP
jgi:SAM-dependent methyltransferase